MRVVSGAYKPTPGCFYFDFEGEHPTRGTWEFTIEVDDDGDRPVHEMHDDAYDMASRLVMERFGPLGEVFSV